MILVFLIPANVWSQEEFNKLNSKGERTGIWKKYYSNKNIRYQGQFKNGKEVGEFKYYSIVTSQHPTIIINYDEKSSKATISYFTEEGIKESDGELLGKERNGKWTFYHPDGKTVMIEEHYNKGILNGSYKSFYSTGKPLEILNYINGVLNGPSKRHADNGVLLDDLNYVNGKLHGKANYYNLEGKLIYTGMYENDVKVGFWDYFGDGENVKENN
ncbi:toxin-antitoxin system YwqK family antitoxin [Lutibacter sp.]|uniref:toxin-antitoxin system YwqK family antitoxin n=1 Tax=Lutibacter sp. TaxID=1925666 RepID=UPI0027370BA3|nr:toxin-antitoxin system YwqK family antitoxin [Lutibacter sp.]MDP3312793.1 toxin-antitoxin system YwqK family antitoxin [Lutibacter sp.]